MSYNFNSGFLSDEGAALRKQIVNDVLFNDEPPDYDEIKIIMSTKDYFSDKWYHWYEKVLTPLYTTRSGMDWSEYGMTYGTQACGGNIRQPTKLPTFINEGGSNITTELYKMVRLQKKQIESQQKQMDELRKMIEILPREEVPTADLLSMVETPKTPKVERCFVCTTYPTHEINGLTYCMNHALPKQKS